ncbi:uncharacterized protein LOC111352063 [Spodoptera litura]|uniref:Uncharacterized protein LOC111352063 n=1 Tax=Spodoptera litura TaxID=69820 RepID=A0A9J7IM25_SPOLT|nr:uncharacterized protein LOC111352063 [Spodoptera litura]
MEWRKAMIIKFIKLFEKEEAIWNPKHENHNYRQKINDAWNRMSVSMGLPVNILKTKKNSLMACFRTHLRRKKKSMKSGKGAEGEDVYEPIWFAYKMMENFLGPVYNCGDTINTEDNASSPSNEALDFKQENIANERDTSTETTEMQNIDHHSRPSQTHTSRDIAIDFPTSTSQLQKHHLQLASEISDAQDKIKQTVETLNNVISQKKRDAEDDDCELYGKLLANKLRYYSKYERHVLMHEIDGLLLKKPPCSITNIPCSSNSTFSPAHDSSDPLS